MVHFMGRFIALVCHDDQHQEEATLTCQSVDLGDYRLTKQQCSGYKVRFGPAVLKMARLKVFDDHCELQNRNGCRLADASVHVQATRSAVHRLIEAVWHRSFPSTLLVVPSHSAPSSGRTESLSLRVQTAYGRYATVHTLCPTERVAAYRRASWLCLEL